LIVSFNTRELRECCASLEKAEAAIGSPHAQELISVLSDAEAADTAAEFIQLYVPIVAVDGDSISLPIGTRYRLSLVAIGVALVRDHQSGLDWRVVRRLKVMDLSQC
jgi:hypothetical protein